MSRHVTDRKSIAQLQRKLQIILQRKFFLYPSEANKAYQPGILFFAFHRVIVNDEYSFNRYLKIIGRELRLNL